MIIMKKNEIILLGFLFLLAFWSLFLPKKVWVYHQIPAKELHYELTKNDKFISVEDVAQAIIEKRTDLILIDVRDTSQYKAFTLPGALNITYDSLLFKTDNIAHNPDLIKVLFSNGNTLAQQCWFMAKRANLKNIYIMDGGLNAWFDNILNPQPPQQPYSNEQDRLYQRRKGLSTYFVGSKNAPSTPTTNKNAIPVQQIKKKESKLGGCS